MVIEPGVSINSDLFPRDHIILLQCIKYYDVLSGSREGMYEAIKHHRPL